MAFIILIAYRASLLLSGDMLVLEMVTWHVL